MEQDIESQALYQLSRPMLSPLQLRYDPGILLRAVHIGQSLGMPGLQAFDGRVEEHLAGGGVALCEELEEHRIAARLPDGQQRIGGIGSGVAEGRSDLGGIAAFGELLERSFVQQRQIDGGNQPGVVGTLAEGRKEGSEGAQADEGIGNGLKGTQFGLLLGAAGEPGIDAEGSQLVLHILALRPAVVVDQALVAAHALTVAAGEDQAGERRLRRLEMLPQQLRNQR